jgi:prepilin-type N-terminal cleavage/methylation domain-containing protein
MKKAQNGFTVIEIILAVVLVGSIAGVGWYVYRANVNANNSLNSAYNHQGSGNPTIKTFDQCKKTKGSKLLQTYPLICQMASGKQFVQNAGNNVVIPDTPHSYTTVTPKITNGYFVIKEWGVRAKHSGNLTLQYAFDNTDTIHANAYFGSTQLAGVVKDECTADEGAAGAINRGKPTDHYIYADGSDTGKTLAQEAADEAKGSQTPYIRQVGNYVYTITGPQGKCAEPDAADVLQGQTKVAVGSIFKNLETVPN